jgi:hypothetical protein
MDEVERTGYRRESSGAAQLASPIVELRQYSLHPGRRDDLIALFDRAFIEPQEAVGMTVIGQFRDLDRGDRFVWLRGFPDMETRARALGAFYNGPDWAAHRNEANATMVTFDDVRLLRPLGPRSGFSLADPRPPLGASEPGGLVVCQVHPLREPVRPDTVALFERQLVPAAEAAGARILASLVTEASPNTFPALPVREGEPVLAWFAGFPNVAAYDRHRAELERSPEGRRASAALAERQSGPPEILRLEPTARSRLRGLRASAADPANAT